MLPVHASSVMWYVIGKNKTSIVHVAFDFMVQTGRVNCKSLWREKVVSLGKPTDWGKKILVQFKVVQGYINEPCI